jgi:hypothetical protein
MAPSVGAGAGCATPTTSVVQGVPLFLGLKDRAKELCGRREPNPHEPLSSTDFHTVYGFRRSLLKIRSEAKDRAVNGVESWVGMPAISLWRTPSQEVAIKLSKCGIWHGQHKRHRQTHRLRWCLDRAGVRAIFVQ